MDKISTIISLNEAKKTIDELIEKVKERSGNSTDNRRLLIIILTVIGALAVIGAIAFAIYRYMSYDDMEEFDDFYDDDDTDELFAEDGLNE